MARRRGLRAGALDGATGRAETMSERSENARYGLGARASAALVLLLAGAAPEACTPFARSRDPRDAGADRGADESPLQDGAGDAPDEGDRDAGGDAPIDGPADAVSDAVIPPDAVVPPDAGLDVIEDASPPEVGLGPEAGDAGGADAPRRDAGLDVIDRDDDIPASVCERADRLTCGANCPVGDTDPSNCGACGNRCATSGVCVAGRCCPEDSLVMCRLPDGVMYPTRTAIDRANCGVCGNTCGDLQNCVCGVCECMPGFTLCGGACVDLQTDSANCASCGGACGGGRTCVRGACALRTAFPQTCGELRPSNRGPHTLYLHNDATMPYQAICEDLGAGPTTWLELRQSDATTNSNYTFERPFAGDASPGGMTTMGAGLLTQFQLVRFDPENERILVQDTRFSTSTGFRTQGGRVYTTALPGVGVDCNSSGFEAQGNLDLTGTPFGFVSHWMSAGYMAIGGERRRTVQRVDFYGGGRCGGVFPDGLDYEFRPMYIRVGYLR